MPRGVRIAGPHQENPADAALREVFFVGIPRGIDGFGGITQQTFDDAILGTSRNSVSQLNQGADSEYNPIRIQAVMNKNDELINALRR